MSSRSSCSSRRRQRGAASVEYLVLLSVVGIAIAAALIGWGPALLQSFSFTRSLLVSPTP
jgi:Flp pilus assembly pilin Flp